MKDKTTWYYCKHNRLKINPEDPKFKMNYCKLGYKECNQSYIIGGCKDFKYSFYKSFKRFFFLRKLWFELHIELWKIRWECNRNATLSAYGVKERGTIKGEIPRKYKGTIEEMRTFEANYIKYLKTHKTKIRDDYNRNGYLELTLYEKYLKEDKIDIDKIPFEWDIQCKRIKKEMSKKE